jgi:glycosyltransferase involved in cell wall biosynthesis
MDREYPEDREASRGPPMTVWLDLTTTSYWKRPPVGTVRVEQSVARWLLAEQPGHTRFCVFHAASGSITEVPRDEVEAWLNRDYATQGHTNPPDATKADLDVEARIAMRVRNTLHRTERYIPALQAGVVRSQLRRSKRAVDAAIRIARHARREISEMRASSQAVTKTPAAAATAPFSRGDVYVTMSVHWVRGDINALATLKQRIGFKVVWMCYDLIPVLYPQLFVGIVAPTSAEFFREMAALADWVLCISENTRRDFLKTIGPDAPRKPVTSVVRLGSAVTRALPAEPGDAVARALASPFILFVSTIERRKNHEVLYRAYTRLGDAGIEMPRLVFVGMPGWGVGDLLNDLRFDPRIRDRIVALNHVSDQELTALYAKCLFTVYPSLYEGWGLPVAESLAHGKYCVASNASSIPEIAGDLLGYLDPWDVPGWMAALRTLVEQPAELRARTERVVREFRPTPWSATAQQVWDAASQLRSADAS